MTARVNMPTFSGSDLPDRVTQADLEANRHTEAALQRHKREGLDLAVWARWVALAVVGIMLPFLNPSWDVLYYEAMLLLLAGIGWLQRRYGRVGRSRAELAVLFLDLALTTIILVMPNPFSGNDWPSAMVYQFENHDYFYILLAAGTLAYSWRTIMAIGTWMTVLWMLAAGLIWWFGSVDAELSADIRALMVGYPEVVDMVDPNSVNFSVRIQEVVVFLIVAYTLALTVRRFNRLLLGNAALERERENLSRYFSPNVVEELSQNDEPLKQIRTHDVAVLFVDIVGFTAYAAERSPQAVIETLRGFHGRMETEVFRHSGTLDKYLGDGLMATFGTPAAGDHDATNALRCAKAMMQTVTQWNTQRVADGLPEITASFGLHFGPVVLGDIGANRLEFAVIGNTVNVASRMEQMTRALAVHLALSDDTRARVIAESGPSDPALAGLQAHADQTIRGVSGAMTVWTLD